MSKAKFFLASFNRADMGKTEYFRNKLKEKDMLADNEYIADYIIAVGDREEVYDCAIKGYKKGTPIIHLWAGESSNWNTYDEFYRHSITIMSVLQLCSTEMARDRVEMLCRAIRKHPHAYFIGNMALDDLSIDKNYKIPQKSYDIILYNPVINKDEIRKDLNSIYKLLEERGDKSYIWIPPNGDTGSDIIKPYINHYSLPRKQFLALLKNCDRFITNSSCQYCEAPFLISKDKIISIGERNKDRESKYSDMSIKGATENAIKILEDNYG